MTQLHPPVPTRPTRAHPLLAVTASTLTVLGLVAALLVAGIMRGSSPARAATGSLQQVTSFGSNPGGLGMYAYTPSGLPSGAPLVIAMHGCTQTANDYFTHSGWAELADRYHFAVVFPQQTSSNNSTTCFRWWEPTQSNRGQGEAASIVQMVDYEKSHIGSDPARVFVTGLSAGGAMTADLLADYPDVFAGGAVDSGIPAKCATTQTQGSNCQYTDQNLTPAQWATKVKDSYPGYSGPYPRVAVWQGTSDYTVYPVNARELRDQWTAVHGLSQTPSGTRDLGAGTTEETYGGATPDVAIYTISGMGHGLAVDPGSGTSQCGSTGSYFLQAVCSSYYTAVFWGLADGSGTTQPTDPTSSPTDPTSSPTGPATCVTDDNYAHTVAGRAYQSGGYTYAQGSGQAMGLWNTYTTHTLKQTGPNYWVIADAGC